MKFSVLKPIYAFLDVEANTKEEAISKARLIPNFMWELTDNKLDSDDDYTVTVDD